MPEMEFFPTQNIENKLPISPSRPLEVMEWGPGVQPLMGSDDPEFFP